MPAEPGDVAQPRRDPQALHGHESRLDRHADEREPPERGAPVNLREAARGHTSEQQIIDWAREHMAAYKVPRIVEFAEALPKSGSGKVMWRLLQEKEPAAR